MMNITNEEFICVTLGVGVVGSIQKFLSKFETLKKFWKKVCNTTSRIRGRGWGSTQFWRAQKFIPNVICNRPQGAKARCRITIWDICVYPAKSLVWISRLPEYFQYFNMYVSVHSQSYISPRKPKYPKTFYQTIFFCPNSLIWGVGWWIIQNLKKKWFLSLF